MVYQGHYYYLHENKVDLFIAELSRLNQPSVDLAQPDKQTPEPPPLLKDLHQGLKADLATRKRRREEAAQQAGGVVGPIDPSQPLAVAQIQGVTLSRFPVSEIIQTPIPDNAFTDIDNIFVNSGRKKDILGHTFMRIQLVLSADGYSFGLNQLYKFEQGPDNKFIRTPMNAYALDVLDVGPDNSRSRSIKTNQLLTSLAAKTVGPDHLPYQTFLAIDRYSLAGPEEGKDGEERGIEANAKPKPKRKDPLTQSLANFFILKTKEEHRSPPPAKPAVNNVAPRPL